MTYTPEQIRQNRKDWIAALRSGQYDQARNFLCRLGEDGKPTGFCCLGVASELAQVPSDDLPQVRLYGGSGSDQVLPLEVREWLGVTESSPSVNIPADHELWEEHGDSAVLAELNDNGMTFAEIADLIEAYGFLPTQDVLSEVSA